MNKYNWEDKTMPYRDCEIKVEQCNRSGSFCDKDMDIAYQQGITDTHEEMRNNSLAYQSGYHQGKADQLNEDIDDLQRILLKNINTREKALIEIVKWLNERVNKDET